MFSESRVQRLLSLVALATLGAIAATWGPTLFTPWALPILFVAFLAAYHFDVRIPGLGSMNADQVVAVPAAAILQNPAVAGLVGGLAILSSRALRRGPRGLRAVHIFDACQVSLSIAAGGWVYLALSRQDRDPSPLWLLHLLVGMAATTAMNLGAFALERFLVGKSLPAATLRGYLRTGTVWLLLSAPFSGLVVHAARTGDPVGLALGALAVLFAVWALRLNADLETKNLALVDAQRRQEFLQQLTLSSAGSLESEPFLGTLVEGLRDFVRWDHGLLLLNASEASGEPVLIAPLGLPADPQRVRKVLLGLLDDPSLMQKPRVTHGEDLPWLLSPGARSQVVALLATPEMAFGALVVERTSPHPFGPEQVSFLETALAQVSRHMQDEILKKQLLSTNRKLLKQTEYLSQILHISNLLKIHFEPQAILGQVALGIRDGLGFRTVLISLFLPEEHCFERIAQAGLDDRWEEIRAVRPPEDNYVPYMMDKFRVANCYLIRHGQTAIGAFDIIPKHMKASQEPGDWHPEDMLLVPLVDRDERLLGVISVDEPEDGRVPTLEALRALEVLANQTVTALEGAQVHARTRRQATLDGLTGLFNHGFFQEALATGAREHAREGRPYVVLMMDLDNFKEINDTRGHLAGDAVLRAVAQVLSGSIRREDVAARYGGEEFAIFLHDQTAAQALPIAERIRLAVERAEVRLDESAEPVRVTLSVGLASFPEMGRDHHVILEKADLALYEAKRAGKNTVRPVPGP
jgi:diguanylate cyclase (GGDEF)-like protein